MKKINTPLNEHIIRDLNAGDEILLSGRIYTARDAAHIALNKLLSEGKALPFDIKGSVIYYVGPTPAPKGSIIGSAGPTSSYRMDALTPLLLKAGLKGMIGKGERSAETIDFIKKYKAVYFAALGGGGVIIADKIKACRVIAFEELGTEAVRELEVKDLPLIVANDMYGRDVFEINRKRFKKYN